MMAVTRKQEKTKTCVLEFIIFCASLRDNDSASAMKVSFILHEVVFLSVIMIMIMNSISIVGRLHQV